MHSPNCCISDKKNFCGLVCLLASFKTSHILCISLFTSNAFPILLHFVALNRHRKKHMDYTQGTLSHQLRFTKAFFLHGACLFLQLKYSELQKMSLHFDFSLFVMLQPHDSIHFIGILHDCSQSWSLRPTGLHVLCVSLLWQTWLKWVGDL